MERLKNFNADHILVTVKLEPNRSSIRKKVSNLSSSIK